MKRQGFTFIELIVVGGILAMLTGLGIFNVSRLQNQSSSSSLLAQLEADFRSQQIAAMNGTTGHGSGSAGVFFNGSSYILFAGTTYVPNSASNFVIDLQMPWTISTTLDNNRLVFSPGSGQIVGLDSGQRLITISNTDSGASSTLYLNMYGAIDE